jgi:hypothetical protein
MIADSKISSASTGVVGFSLGFRPPSLPFVLLIRSFPFVTQQREPATVTRLPPCVRTLAPLPEFAASRNFNAPCASNGRECWHMHNIECWHMCGKVLNFRRFSVIGKCWHIGD